LTTPPPPSRDQPHQTRPRQLPEPHARRVRSSQDPPNRCEATRSANRIRGLRTGIHPAPERAIGSRTTHPAVQKILSRRAGPTSIRGRPPQAGRPRRHRPCHTQFGPNIMGESPCPHRPRRRCDVLCHAPQRDPLPTPHPSRGLTTIVRLLGRLGGRCQDGPAMRDDSSQFRLGAPRGRRPSPASSAGRYRVNMLSESLEGVIGVTPTATRSLLPRSPRSAQRWDMPMPRPAPRVTSSCSTSLERRCLLNSAGRSKEPAATAPDSPRSSSNRANESSKSADPNARHGAAPARATPSMPFEPPEKSSAARLVDGVHPELAQLPGVGALSAAQILINWSHHGPASLRSCVRQPHRRRTHPRLLRPDQPPPPQPRW
jgi:hypothetical protein